jgi:solute:Na+ symporter, SSS family
LNAITFAGMTVCSSGVSMYAMAKLIETLHLFDKPFAALGLPQSWIFHFSILLSAVIVLGYIFFGGLTSAIYNEVLQFFLIIAGFLPLVLLGLKDVGGWEGLRASLDQKMVHTWVGMGDTSTNLMGVEWFSMAMGLGFVLSFGYWCTDFLVVQRAMAAESMLAARRTPLIAAIPKMFFPFLVIMPGLIAIAPVTRYAQTHASANSAIVRQEDAPAKGLVPAKLDAQGQPKRDAQGNVELDYDLVIPQLLLHYFPPGMLGLGLTALLASFMSGMAGNVTAFNTVWTYDIYQAYIKKDASDEHYLWMGRMATVFGIVFSMAAAYAATAFNNIMDLLQLVFAFVNAPLLATFLLGMFWKRTTGSGAFYGLLAGTVAAVIHHGLTLPITVAEAGIKGGWLAVVKNYPSEMAQNFWTAIIAWVVCFVVTILISFFTTPRPDEELQGLVYELTERPAEDDVPWWKRPWALAVMVLLMALVLNLIFY